jgi:hypothetical protein
MVPFGVEWILSASLRVSDAESHSPTKPIAKEGAQAIEAACSKVRLVTGEDPRYMCASVYLVQAFKESGYNLFAIGDGGKARGPFQVHTLSPPKTWDEAVKQFTPILQRSAQTCEEPLAMLASGSCTNKAGIRISRVRMAEARAIALGK